MIEEKDAIASKILDKSMLLERLGILVILYKSLSDQFEEE